MTAASFACTALLFLAGYYYVALCTPTPSFPDVSSAALAALTFTIFAWAVVCTSIALYISEEDV